jgi:glutamate/tyrosine decarboxylase-like PLP-dependent enzyme
MPLPAAGRPAATVYGWLDAMRRADAPTTGERGWAHAPGAGLPDVRAVAARAAAAYAAAGPDPVAFPSLRKLEYDVVGAVAGLLGGGQETPGAFTHAAAEAILLAMRAARDAAPGGPRLLRPQVVAPATADPAFARAAGLLGMELTRVPVDPMTLRADPAAMAAAITDRTVLLAISAPCGRYGLLDPVVEIAGLAAAYGLPCHVDAGTGGLLLPFARRLGVPVPPADLAVPGVTSMSVDLYGQGYAPRGAGVLLSPGAGPVRDRLLAPSGTALAASWAVLLHLGEQGYLELARRTLRATRALAAGLAAVDGVALLVEPEAAVLAFTVETADVFAVADGLRARGWRLRPRLRHSGIPAHLRLPVTAAAERSVGPFLADLAAEVVAAEAAGPPEPVDPALVAAAASLDPATATEDQFAGLLALSGLSGAGPGDTTPGGSAPVNRLLDALPPALRARLRDDHLAVGP